MPKNIASAWYLFLFKNKYKTVLTYYYHLASKYVDVSNKTRDITDLYIIIVYHIISLCVLFLNLLCFKNDVVADFESGFAELG